MGGCCTTKVNTNEQPNKLVITKMQYRQNQQHYAFEIVQPSTYSSRIEEKVEKRAKQKPHKLFKQTNVHACFKHAGESFDIQNYSDSQSDCKSEPTMPTDLGGSGHLVSWMMS